MDAREIKFLNAFNSLPNLGASALRSFKEKFGSFEEAWSADDYAMQELHLPEATYNSVLWKRPSVNPDREMSKLVRENIWIMTEDDAAFPEMLKEIPYPPIMLYGRGDPDLLKKMQSRENKNRKISIGVVGARKPTAYGLEATGHIVQGLSDAGIVITSGLAVGVDSKAHRIALDAGGHTIAVLGSGVDDATIYPQENVGLARKIIESSGIVISEYAPATPAIKEHFPQRNRIISGLSRATLVIEAREKSGALITANFALEQNRDVFALPGSIFSLASCGTNKLIQEGAKLITSARDILGELGLDYTEKEVADRYRPSDEKEARLLDALEEPVGVDLIKEKTGLDTAAIISNLSLLELKGRIRNLGGDLYQKIN